MGSIVSQIKSGIFWNVLSSFARYGLQFIAVMVLARRITPEEYALVGILSIFINVADALVDAGLGGAVIKKTNASSIDFSTLTVYNLVVSVVIYLLYLMGASWVADYYSQPRLEGLLQLYSVCIIVYALSVAPRAYLVKMLRFKEVALLNSFSGAIALIVAIILAYLDFKSYTIVWQYLVNSIVFSIGAIYLAKLKFSFAFSWTSFKEQFSFGFYTMLTLLCKMINENIYNNVIGKKVLLTQTGFFSQSSKLMNIPVSFLFNMIEGTYFPVMSQIVDRDEFERKIIQLNQKTMGIIILLFSTLIPFGREIVYILLGENWLGMVWTVKILFLSGLFISLSNVSLNLIKSTGKTYLMLYSEAIILIMSILTLFYVADKGYEAIVYCFLIFCIIKFILVTSVACYLVRINLVRFIRPLGVLILLCALFVYLFSMISIDNILLSVGLKLCLYLIIVSISYFCFRKKLKDFRDQLHI